jgi:glycosyltransferase involved in cell wall biosynthesis
MATSLERVSRSTSLVGHPYVPIGMGEHVRSTYRALRSVAMRPIVTDIYKLTPPDTDELEEFAGICSDTPSDINIFHINGNEVEQSLAHLGASHRWDGYNVIYPLWELARYPEEWARQLDRFDEIWAPSRFIHDGLQRACARPVFHMPLSCEVRLGSFLGRRHFRIPENDYTFLFFYDLRSYSSRKYPQAVIRAFRQLLAARPSASTHLIIKMNGVETNPQAFSELQQDTCDLGHRVTLFHQVMGSNEVKNLVRCSDCFVSLHRSEGYGFGIAEAMVLGKPVIATAYSGNMDFMIPGGSYGIGYRLIPVNEGDYPHAHDQVWAEPDVDQAASCMVTLVDDHRAGWVVGHHARLHMKKHFSYGAIGMNYRARLDQIGAAI